MERVTDFISWAPKITADGDCSHEIKRCLLLEKESYDKPRQCIKKQRHHFANKGLYGQSYGSSIVGLVVLMVKNLPAMKETWVRSLVWEDPLEKGMATHSSILAWRMPWTEEPGGLQSMGLQSWTQPSD